MSFLNTISFPLIMLYFFQTSISCTGNKKDIKGISVIYHVPIVNNDSSIVNTESSYDKFYYSDLVLYRYNYNHNDFLEDKLLSSERRYYYFVFHKDSARGRLYSPYPVKALTDGLYSVDSVVKKNRIYNDRVDVLAAMSPDSVYYLPNGDKVRTYNPVPDTAQPEPYQLSFYYTKWLRDINEKLSDKMDNEPGMTLYKINIHSDGFYYEKFKMKFPARDYILEIKELAPEKDPEVLKYFDQYQHVMKD